MTNVCFTLTDVMCELMTELLSPTNSAVLCSVCELPPQTVWLSELGPHGADSCPGGGGAGPGLQHGPGEGGTAGEGSGIQQCFVLFIMQPPHLKGLIKYLHYDATVHQCSASVGACSKLTGCFCTVPVLLPGSQQRRSNTRHSIGVPTSGLTRPR